MRLLPSYCLRESKFLSLNLLTQRLAYAHGCARTRTHTQTHRHTIYHLSQPVPCWMPTTPGQVVMLGMWGEWLLHFSTSWALEVKKKTYKVRIIMAEAAQRHAIPTPWPSLPPTSCKGVGPSQCAIGMCNNNVSACLLF